MTLAVYEQDLRKMGYLDAKLEFESIIKKKEAQIAELKERIAKTEAILKEALARIDALNVAK